jgi:uncharacterized protein (DUF4415 family)
MKRTVLKKTDKPTKEQISQIIAASKRKPFPDADSPVYTYEEISQLYAASKKRNVKKTVGLRLDSETIDWYRSLGKGYTGLMAKVLEYSAQHPEVIRAAI